MTENITQATAAETAIADAKRLIANLELPYLIELQRELDKHIAARSRAGRQDAIDQCWRIARGVDMTVEALLATSAAREPAPAKYRDPDTGQEWSGRGRYPQWLRDRLGQGAGMEQFAI